MKDNELGRRDFFRLLGRGVFLGSFAVAGAWLAGKGKVDPSEHMCVNKSVCCNCAKFAKCGLPAALSAREAGVIPVPEGGHRG